MARVVGEEFAAARGDTWSSKDMLELIRRKSQVRRGPCKRPLTPSPPLSLSRSLSPPLTRAHLDSHSRSLRAEWH